MFFPTFLKLFNIKVAKSARMSKCLHVSYDLCKKIVQEPGSILTKKNYAAMDLKFREVQLRHAFGFRETQEINRYGSDRVVPQPAGALHPTTSYNAPRRNTNAGGGGRHPPPRTPRPAPTPGSPTRVLAQVAIGLILATPDLAARRMVLAVAIVVEAVLPVGVPALAGELLPEHDEVVRKHDR